MAVLELQRGDPAMINDLPRLLGAVTPDQVVAAAATLRPERRASQSVLPGAAQSSPDAIAAAAGAA